MESEKVKEIKESLRQSVIIEEKIFGKPIANSFNDILTLINELESENERLILQYERVKADSEMNCLELKDRIAELEKENAKLLDSVETVQSNRCVYKCVLTKEHLTKFAERLKEKCEWNRKQYCCEATVSANDIDETLKEFIK